MTMRAMTLILLAVVPALPVLAWTDPDARDVGPVGTFESPAATTTTGDGQPAPKAVRRVSLLIKGTNDREWSRFGLSDGELARAIGERLARFGIDVTSAARDVPVLEVDAHVNDQTFNNSYIVFIRLKDRLTLPQSPDGFVTRTLWSDWKLGGFEPYNYRKLRAAILEVVDRFGGQPLLAR